ncbi:MAG: RNA methyltransferase [Lactobacillus sp.]|jgi:TrmH family RNA methyltransferase|nr:RNA methyltransferase [Lactobacillus sp.]MCH3990362.1 RNA methyltransferase [Lactobacillus sp.]MCH4068923.1 RNA methyltransferase [Lactobacillus sp.]MCI1303325.1 RNA methyltransferase [Lactobacillus sp.]MCI1329401.1 RNA methyltransferase [Lactobacillus sp.]
MQQISSVNNEKIKSIHKLLQKKYRQHTGLYLIEGFHLVTEALQAQLPVQALLGTQASLDRLQAETNIDLNDDKIYLINEAICRKLSSTHNSQAIFMVLKQAQPKHFSFNYGKWVILDNLTDPGNVGTIIRTADAAGFTGVIFSPTSVDLYNPKVQRSMQGSQFHLEIITADLPAALGSFHEAGIPIYISLLDRTAKPLTDFSPVSQLALIIGNEAHGAEHSLIPLADEKLYIPIKGKAESLNAAVAAGIMIYHFA